MNEHIDVNKYLGKPVERELDDGTKIYIPQLGIESLYLFLKIQGSMAPFAKMQKAGEVVDESLIQEHIMNNNNQEISKLVEMTVDKMFSSWTPEQRSQFALENYDIIVDGLMEANTSKLVTRNMNRLQKLKLDGLKK